MNRLFQNAKTNNGFTLIELIFVVSVIGILALLGFRLYINQQDRAKEAIVKGNMCTVQTLIQGEFADNNDQTLAETRLIAGSYGIKNPYTGVNDSGFDTPEPGAIVITSGASNGSFIITGYGENAVALPNPLTACP